MVQSSVQNNPPLSPKASDAAGAEEGRHIRGGEKMKRVDSKPDTHETAVAHKTGLLTQWSDNAVYGWGPFWQNLCGITPALASAVSAFGSNPRNGLDIVSAVSSCVSPLTLFFSYYTDKQIALDAEKAQQKVDK